MEFKSLLVVLNSLNYLELILKKALFLAKKFNANIEVLYVEERALFDINEVLYQSEFNQEEIKNKIKEVVSKLTNSDIAIFVKIDDTQDRVWDLVRDRKDILIVTEYNEDTTYKLIKNIKQSIYIIKSHNFEYNSSVLIIDTLKINECLNFSKSNFKNIDEIVYSFNYVPYIDPIDPITTVAIENGELILKTEQDEFNKLLKEHNINGKIFINGYFENLSLQEYINRYDFAIICRKDDEILDTLDNILKKFKGDIFIEWKEIYLLTNQKIGIN